MNIDQVRLCLQLHSIPEIDNPLLTRMLLASDSPAELAEAGPARWTDLGMTAQAAQALASSLGGGRCVFDVESQLASLGQVGAEIVPITDVRYPPLLRTIPDPPPMLYVRGDVEVLSRPQLAMVGSRRASSAGLRCARSLAGEAVLAGLRVTSGMARGIDGEAHRGALAAGGQSVAVVATGIDRVYPAQHRGLAVELEQAGCLVSEFPPGVAPLRQNFPRRNRMISGLALGVVVVEAALPSGSLITARTALEQGREVFALPWSIQHTGGAGCLYLIRDGAKLVQTIQDVLEELGPMYSLQRELELEPAPGAETSAGTLMSEPQRQLLQLVGYESVSVDELSRLSALPVAHVLAALSFLEMQGVVARTEGGYIRA